MLKRYVIRIHRDQEGLALVAVVGMMAVGLLLSSLILSSVVTGIGYTSSTRAGVQSQASAEAGIAAATVALRAGNCSATSGVFQSAVGASPQYLAKVYSQNGSGTWAQSCPVSGTTAVKIESGGTAAALGAAGQSGGDKSKVEAIFTTTPSTPQVLELGPAVYAYAAQGYSGSGTLVSADPGGANVMVREGTVNCDGAGNASGDLVVKNGDLNIGAGCVIGGNVWASGKVTISGGVAVGGSVVASEVNIVSGGVAGTIWASGKVTIGSAYNFGGNIIGNEVSITNNAQVAGSVWSNTSFVGTWNAKFKNIYAKTDITMGGAIFTGTAIAGNKFTATNWAANGGSVIAKTIIGDGVNVPGNASAMTFPTNQFTVGGTKTTLGAAPNFAVLAPAAPTTPITPTVPAWPDYKYVAGDWAGFAFATVASPCKTVQFNNAINSVGGQKVVLDARACTSPITIDTCSDTCDVIIQNDTAILGKAFDFGGSLEFKSTVNHSLWFITEDTVADTKPSPALASCSSSNGNFTTAGGVVYSPNLDMLVYTPCKVAISSGTKWRGQIFAGATVVDGSAKITFTAVGLPGLDLSTGLPVVVTGAAAVWTLQSTRNLAP